MNSKIRVRLVWRLVLFACGHLTLLLAFAIYLEFSLISVQQYAPLADAEEVQLESLDVIPTLLGSMNLDRLASGRNVDPRYAEALRQSRRQVEQNLASLNDPRLLVSAAETERRAVIRQWLAEVSNHPGPASDAMSRALLDRLDQLTAQVRDEVRQALLGLQRQEADEANGRVRLMWILVGLVMVFTLIIQYLLTISIVGPILSLQNTVRRLQAGDYTARAQLKSGDEIQSLGETFNDMAENIRQSQRQLEQKNGTLLLQQEALRHANASLEARVSEKTEELRKTLDVELSLRQEVEDKNQKLSAAARLKDEFLATLSHELRTPLMPVITCAHLLGSDPSLNGENHKSVRVIERNARALSRMIDELLDLSAVMNRKLSLSRERTEMNEWTRTTLETMRPAWEKKGLTLNFVPASAPVELEIDPTRLAQVLTNLINNAIKFTDRGGRITVRLTALKKEFRMAVSDNGAGLNRSEIDRIFEMFHQAPTGRTEGAGGLGVGLTVARSLSELHGGGLRAESSGPGEGATFTLWLPQNKSGAADADSTGPIPSVTAVDRAPLRGRNVLLVEDSTDTREALQRIFERRECRVRAAATAEEALEMAMEDPPEIVISDIGLPGMSGLELIVRLKALPGLGNVIAIALSGLGRERDIKAAADGGFDAHLLKPVEMAVLDRTLIETLERRTATL
jgi:signal transduction histidine kinase/ActR/RegA family two-component response regulator